MPSRIQLYDQMLVLCYERIVSDELLLELLHVICEKNTKIGSFILGMIFRLWMRFAAHKDGNIWSVLGVSCETYFREQIFQQLLQSCFKIFSLLTKNLIIKNQLNSSRNIFRNEKVNDLTLEKSCLKCERICFINMFVKYIVCIYM